MGPCSPDFASDSVGPARSASCARNAPPAAKRRKRSPLHCGGESMLSGPLRVCEKAVGSWWFKQHSNGYASKPSLTTRRRGGAVARWPTIIRSLRARSKGVRSMTTF